MKKIALICQRYGLEVNGGAEYYTRLIAERLISRYDVEVLTTKAVDYVTWKNEYENDEEVINGVFVKRFTTSKERKMEKFGKVNSKILQDNTHTIEDEMKWVDEQGPFTPQLIQYIKDNKDEYAAFIFVTYLYYHSIMGIPEVSDKAILVPTAHDEPYIYFKIFDKIFNLPKAFVYLTEEEKKFVTTKFQNSHIMNEVMAVGVDVPENIDAKSFKEHYGLEDYIIYVGRIDESKGCDWLFKYFEEYRKRNDRDIKLVLMGKEVLKVPNAPDILNLGFVDEEEKFSGISGAKALILPSAFESLSIAVLEAMALGIPVIVNGRCEVLKGHCIKSNGGLYYKNYYEFEGALNYMLSHQDEYMAMKQNAEKYVNMYFKWDIIMNKFEKLIESI